MFLDEWKRWFIYNLKYVTYPYDINAVPFHTTSADSKLYSRHKFLTNCFYSMKNMRFPSKWSCTSDHINKNHCPFKTINKVPVSSFICSYWLCFGQLFDTLVITGSLLLEEFYEISVQKFTSQQVCVIVSPSRWWFLHTVLKSRGRRKNPCRNRGGPSQCSGCSPGFVGQPFVV